MEEEFERIAQDAINEAQEVKCDFAEFVEGLKVMVQTIQDRYEQAASELRGQQSASTDENDED